MAEIVAVQLIELLSRAQGIDSRPTSYSRRNFYSLLFQAIVDGASRLIATDSEIQAERNDAKISGLSVLLPRARNILREAATDSSVAPLIERLEAQEGSLVGRLISVPAEIRNQLDSYENARQAALKSEGFLTPGRVIHLLQYALCPHAAQQAVDSPLCPTGSRTVLIVDDDPLWRYEIETAVRKRWPLCDVVAVSCADEARRTLEQHGAFGTVVIDLVIPDKPRDLPSEEIGIELRKLVETRYPSEDLVAVTETGARVTGFSPKDDLPRMLGDASDLPRIIALT